MNLAKPSQIQLAPQSTRGVHGMRLQRKCACGQHTIGGAACSECSRKGRTVQRATDAPRLDLDPRELSIEQKSQTLPVIQRKLTVNEPGDIYEREADYIAEQVTRSSAANTNDRAPERSPALNIHRTPAGT